MSIRAIATTAILVCSLVPSIAWAQFETRSGVSVLSSPNSIAVGDFNKDGIKDLAVVAFSSGKVAVLLGNGNGTFRQPSYYDAVASSLAVADFRNNGTLDLALTDNLSNQLQILLGNGDGTFGPSAFYPTPNFPNVIAVGDFNNDHNIDVVTVDQSGICPCISILLGRGDGTFHEPPMDFMPPDPAAAIGVGDFNRDGNLDLVTVGSFGSGSQAGILLGNGDGTFTPGESYTLGSGPQSVAVIDLNGDGNLDSAVADALAGSIDILLGNGDGTFRQGATLAASFASEIVAADLNGDGKPDLIVLTGVYSTSVNVFYGNGDGTFRAPVTFPAGGESAAPTVADFNGDHKNDIVLANYLGNAVNTILNTGVVAFSPMTPLNFKKQTVGTTSVPQAVKLTNTGKAELKISSMKASQQFAMTSTCESTLAAGAKCTISVTFSPTSRGAKSGTVTINDSASSKPMVIELSGIGD